MIIGAAGSLQNALGASYTKFVVDNEIIGYIKRMVAGIPFNPETMALDVIKQVGPAGHFLTQDHTLRHFRQALFRPLLSSRAAYAQWELQGRKSIDQKATEEAERILREHQPEPLPPEVEKELWDVVRLAESRQA